jgi:hypothetical protein
MRDHVQGLREERALPSDVESLFPSKVARVDISRTVRSMEGEAVPGCESHCLGFVSGL